MIKATFAPAFALVGALALMSAGGAQAASKTSSCNRACLEGTMTRYLDAMVKHDPAAAPLAKTVRFTENGIDLAPGEGFWKTIDGLGTYRQNVLDVRAHQSGAYLVAMEGGKPVLFAVRLRVENRQITEIETQVSHSNAEAGGWEIEKLVKADPRMTYVPKGKERMSRAELVRIAMMYPQGLRAAKSFVADPDLPMIEAAYRRENGMTTGGPDSTRGAGTKNMKTQNLFIAGGRPNFQARVVAVDEDLGIVWTRVSWRRPAAVVNGVTGPARRFVAFEAFKVYDGKLHAAEAFLRFEPLENTGGWGVGAPDPLPAD